MHVDVWVRILTSGIRGDGWCGVWVAHAARCNFPPPEAVGDVKRQHCRRHTTYSCWKNENHIQWLSQNILRLNRGLVKVTVVIFCLYHKWRIISSVVSLLPTVQTRDIWSETHAILCNPLSAPYSEKQQDVQSEPGVRSRWYWTIT